MFYFPSKLYPITDIRLSGLTPADQVTQLAAGGAPLVQLREKDLSPRSFFAEAEMAMAAARASGTKVIINDRVDLALCLGADGVHLGQDDLPPQAARELLGPDAIIGFSTHTPDQARRATALPIDYLAIGPIFATSTKSNPDDVVGLDGLRRVRGIVRDLPLVAIGGITLENAREVISAGADVVAVISALYQKPSQIPEITRSFLAALHSLTTR
jgi:thiamine-phosphate pyrophosphorylase